MSTQIEVESPGKSVVERCGKCVRCGVAERIDKNVECCAMHVTFPDGSTTSEATDQEVVAKVKTWCKAAGVKFAATLIQWGAGTGHAVFKGTAHEPVQCNRLHGWMLRYHNKSWSDAFECPTCKTRRRFNINYLGRRRIMCDGQKFTKVER